MKKAAVATTTARGAAVKSNKITAVQSVYIPQASQVEPIISVSRAAVDTTTSRADRGLLPRLATNDCTLYGSTADPGEQGLGLAV